MKRRITQRPPVSATLLNALNGLYDALFYAESLPNRNREKAVIATATRVGLALIAQDDTGYLYRDSDGRYVRGLWAGGFSDQVS